MYYECLTRSEAAFQLDEVKKEFHFVHRISCADGDAAIGRFERALAAVRVGQRTLRNRCCLHKLSHILESALDLAPETIRRIKHMVLSLRFGNHMKLFRTAFRATALEKLDIIRQSLPSGSQCRRHRELLDLFMPDSPECRTKRLTVLALMTGDWSDRDVVTTHASPSDSDATVMRRIVTALTSALVGSGPTSFPGRSFVHAEDSPQWIGALEACHGLFTSSYLRFCLMLKSSADVDAGRVRPGRARLVPRLGDQEPLVAIAEGYADNDGVAGEAAAEARA